MGAFSAGIPVSQWYRGLSTFGQYAVDYGISTANSSFEKSRGQDETQRETTAKIVGGTYSQVTGGKFANGAINQTERYRS